MTNLNEVLIVDIECWSDYDIDKENAYYLEDAKTKWIGFYSYKYNRYDTVKVKDNEDKIIKYIEQHKVLVTFNGDAFDIPILKNSKNNFINDKWKKYIDLYVFLFGNEKGKKPKYHYMGFDFPSRSLRVVAETLNFETLKGDIDYLIFKKDEWTEEEEKEIKLYLMGDIKVTKLLFDKIYNFWLPFASFIGEKNASKWRWLTSSMASIGYMYACETLGKEEIYNQGDRVKKDFGGKVIEPRKLEATGIYYCDIVSMYPHNYALFNLFSETGNKNDWHGNNVFKVHGYYNISQPNILSSDMMIKLRERIRLKKIDKHNPLVYAYKILLNSMFGTSYSEMFASLYTENCGRDCCYLGQQINDIMERMFTEMGYEVIAGDTDSNFIKPLNGQDKEQVKKDLSTIRKFILSNVPFPQETFSIEIEAYIDYIMYVKGEDKTLKKNYVYVSNKELHVMGLPIIKSNASKLGPLILNKYLKEQIINNLSAKFDKKYIDTLIKLELHNDITLIAQKYKCNRYELYGNNTNCIQKQISLKYLDKKSGTISLIKNKNIGKVGTGWKYCTIDDAKKLEINDLDLTKVYNELEPFIKNSITKTGGLSNYGI
jgi:DNA polymerase elongation subunit (family B)